MIVPETSQLVDGQGGDRCGEACLSSCLMMFNVSKTMYQICDEMGKPRNHATSTIGELIDAAHHYGLTANILMTQQQTEDALKYGKAVIVLCWNGALDPLPYPHAPGWIANHFVVWENIPGTHGKVSLMDPLAYPGSNHVLVTYESLIAAIRAVDIQAWGLSLEKMDKLKIPLPKGPKV